MSVFPFHFKRLFTVVLLMFAGIASAERFGDINLTRYHNGLLSYPDGGGVSCNYILRFKATNTGKKAAVLELRLEQIAIRKARLEPGASTILTFQVPTGTDSYRYWSPSLKILVDSKEYLHSLSISSPWDRPTRLLFSNSLPEDKLKYIFCRAVSHLDKELMAIDSVENWSRDINDYMGYRAIWVDSQEHIPEDVMKTLRQWMVDGGHLIRCVMPGSEWPKGTPQPKEAIHAEQIGKGSLVTFRPFKQAPGKEVDEFVNQVRSNASNYSSQKEDPPLPDVVNHSQEVQSIISDALSTLDLEIQNHFQAHSAQVNPHLIKAPRLSLMPLMLVMLLFALLVGPANYIFLWKRHKEPLMLVTIPLVSLLFCLLVLGYVSISFGFRLEGKILGVSYFDQSEKVASSIYLCSLMANSTNRREMRFSESDHVTFLNDQPTLFVADKPGMVLMPGILRPRNPVEYMTRRCELRNERVRLLKKEGEAQAVNGLPVPMSYLIARDENGNAFISTGAIAEGSRMNLTPRPNAKPVEDTSLFDGYPVRLLAGHIGLTSVNSPQEMEALFTLLPPNSFLAVCPEPCFGTPGIRPDKGTECYVVFGPVTWE